MLFIAKNLCKDLVILFIVSITLGAALASVIGEAAHTYFGDTVADLIGEYGEYDLLLTINGGMRKQAEERLRVLLEGFPGAFFKEGLSIPGKINFYVALGAGRTREGFMRMLQNLEGFPGLSSYSVIAEPRISIKGVPPGALPFIEEALSHQAAILFFLPTFSGLEIFIETPDHLPAVSNEVETLVRSYQVLNVNLGTQLTAGDLGLLRAGLERDLARDLRLPVRDISQGESERPSWLVQVEKLIDLILIYVPAYRLAGHLNPGEKVNLSLAGEDIQVPLWVYKSEGDETLLLPLAEAKGSSGPVYREDGTYVGQALPEGRGWDLARGLIDLDILPRDQIMDLVGNLSQLEDLLGVALSLQNSLSSMSEAADGVVLGDFLALLDRLEQIWAELGRIEAWSEAWVNRIEQTERILSYRRLFLAPDGSLESRLHAIERDLGKLKELLAGLEGTLRYRYNGLARLGEWRHNLEILQEFMVERPPAEILSVVEGLELPDIKGVQTGLASILQMENGPSEGMSPVELTDGLMALQQLQQGWTKEGEIMLLLPAQIKEDLVKRQVVGALAPFQASIEVQSLGIFQPDFRGEIFRVLGEVRLTITALVVVVVTFLILLLDHTLIISLAATLRRYRGGSLWYRLLNYEGFYGFFAGAFTMGGIMWLAGGEIPYLEGYRVIFLGGLFGLVTTFIAPKVNPISRGEFAAGEAAGMELDGIMREIVLPAARPGIWVFLNRPNQIFR